MRWRPVRRATCSSKTPVPPSGVLNETAAFKQFSNMFKHRVQRNMGALEGYRLFFQNMGVAVGLSGSSPQLPWCTPKGTKRCQVDPLCQRGKIWDKSKNHESPVSSSQKKKTFYLQLILFPQKKQIQSRTSRYPAILVCLDSSVKRLEESFNACQLVSAWLCAIVGTHPLGWLLAWLLAWTSFLSSSFHSLPNCGSLPATSNHPIQKKPKRLS